MRGPSDALGPGAVRSGRVAALIDERPASLDVRLAGPIAAHKDHEMEPASGARFPRNSGAPTDGGVRLGVAQKEVCFSRKTRSVLFAVRP